MPKSIVVTTRNAEPSDGNGMGLVAQLTAAVGCLSAILGDTMYWKLQLVLCTLLVAYWIPKKTAAKYFEVKMYPSFIQLLGRDENNMILGQPTLIPIDEIIDCVVIESIRAYKVINTLVFRLQQHDGEKSIRLLELFPGSDLTYHECLSLRREIIKWET